MRICFLGVNDWANECNKIARAINRAGTDLSARCVTQVPHPFGYREDIVTERRPDDRVLAERTLHEADVIVTTGDGDYAGFDSMLAEYGGSGKPVVAMHVGTAYRQRWREYDAMDRARGWRRRFVSPDLYRFVKDDPEARIYLIPHDDLAERPPRRDGGRLRVLHAPSNRELKRTDEVERGFRAAEAQDPRIVCRTLHGVKAPAVWAAMRESDVFVDHLYEAHGGIGGAAQEAASYGLAVLSDLRMICRETMGFMGRFPGKSIESADDISAWLLHYAKAPDRLADEQSASLAWAREHLSPGAIAAYWKENLS